MNYKNLRVSDAESMAFEDIELNQPNDFVIKVATSPEKNYSLKPLHASTRVKIQRKIGKRDQQYKCFKCFGGGEPCRVCQGSRAISHNHPIVAAMEEILKKKAFSEGSSESKIGSSKNMLAVDPKFQQIIKEESFSVPEESWETCQKCNKQFQLSELKRKGNDKICKKCDVSTSNIFLTTERVKKEPYMSRLRKISEQIDSEEGLSIILKAGKTPDSSEIKNQFSEDLVNEGEGKTETKMKGGKPGAMENDNILFQSLQLLEEISEQKKSLEKSQNTSNKNFKTQGNSRLFNGTMEISDSWREEREVMNPQEWAKLQRLQSWKIPESIQFSSQLPSEFSKKSGEEERPKG